MKIISEEDEIKVLSTLDETEAKTATTICSEIEEREGTTHLLPRIIKVLYHLKDRGRVSRSMDKAHDSASYVITTNGKWNLRELKSRSNTKSF